MRRDKARLGDDRGGQQPRERYNEVATRPRRSSPPPHRPPQRRSVWPWLLIGCAGGIGILVLAAAIVDFVAIRGATGSSILPVNGHPPTYTQQCHTQRLGLPQLTGNTDHD